MDSECRDIIPLASGQKFAKQVDTGLQANLGFNVLGFRVLGFRVKGFNSTPLSVRQQLQLLNTKPQTPTALWA